MKCFNKQIFLRIVFCFLVNMNGVIFLDIGPFFSGHSIFCSAFELWASVGRRPWLSDFLVIN